MGFTVPNARNYVNPLNAVPLDWITPPVEGAKGIQCSIQWNQAEAGPNNSVYLNLQNNAPLNFSKVRAVVFDNSLNGSDVQIIFPDTETTITIPAYTPYAIVPVFTNQTQFYIVSPNAVSTDATNFMILNTLPPPLAVPTTQEQNFEGVAGINAQATGTKQLVAAGINGTLEAYSLMGILVSSATGGSITINLQDGNGRVFHISTGAVDGSSEPINFANINFANLSDLRLRFVNGLILSWLTLAAPQAITLAANVYYRTP